MKKFWKWMEKKGCATLTEINDWVLMYSGSRPTNKMLIGYMIEYLFEHGAKIIHIEKDNIKDSVYNILKREIEEIEINQ